jgi:hypothetical protein
VLSKIGINRLVCAEIPSSWNHCMKCLWVFAFEKAVSICHARRYLAVHWHSHHINDFQRGKNIKPSPPHSFLSTLKWLFLYLMTESSSPQTTDKFNTLLTSAGLKQHQLILCSSDDTKALWRIIRIKLRLWDVFALKIPLNKDSKGARYQFMTSTTTLPTFASYH